jgi:hypothetical protein
VGLTRHNPNSSAFVEGPEIAIRPVGIRCLPPSKPRCVVTVIAGVVVALTFIFGFNNVRACAGLGRPAGGPSRRPVHPGAQTWTPASSQDGSLAGRGLVSLGFIDRLVDK